MREIYVYIYLCKVMSCTHTRCVVRIVPRNEFIFLSIYLSLDLCTYFSVFLYVFLCVSVFHSLDEYCVELLTIWIDVGSGEEGIAYVSVNISSLMSIWIHGYVTWMNE